MTAQQQREILEIMTRSRRFQQAANHNYSHGDQGGFLMLDIGQESIAACVRTLMGENDHSVCNQRGIGMAVASGIPFRSIMAELHGKSAGCSRGKGGALSLFCPENHHWGSYAVAGSQVPISAGLAFALKYREQDGMVFCMMGEASMNQGVVHESFNLMGLFDLPVVVVIENNQYSFWTKQRRSTAFKDYVVQRAEGYDIDWAVVKGDEISSLWDALSRAREKALTEHRPTFIEVETYRYYGATIADSNHKKCRSPEEINYYKEHRDPLKKWMHKLIHDGLVSEGDYEVFTKEVKAEASDSIKWARQQDPPTLSEIQENVYWETDHQTAASQQGRHFFS